ncbi:uncharacterized protein [Rutidosis leptorrhynchoides]|uniref:uncharacterized protein n=1 Tax=Rutidosis leptorrhynchoides TaxID=125765 RepID=UPI003A992DD9
MGKKKKLPQASTSRVLRNRKLGEDNEENLESEGSDSNSEIESKKQDMCNSQNPSLIDLRELEPNVGKEEHEYEKVSVYSASIDGSIHEDEIEFPELNKKSKTNSPVVNSQQKVMENNLFGQEPLAKSYLNAVGGDQPKQKVNFSFVENIVPSDEDVDVLIPIESIVKATNRYKNTLYGYFLGRRLPFPVVNNYVMNTWKKFGIEKIMMNAKGFYFFKFETEQGLLNVLEGGPWMIRTVPIILNKWTPEVSLSKEDLTRVPVWVKMYDIPLAAFTAVVLSAIGSKIGKPMLLDSYTATMCTKSWGRPNYARALIEVDSENDLKQSLKVGTPNLEMNRKTIDEVRIEYEWKPPRCSCCKVFGHSDAQCPKTIPVAAETVVETADGFKQVVNRNCNKGKTIGFTVNHAKPKFVYRPKPNAAATKPTGASTSRVKTIENPFEALNNCNDEGEVLVAEGEQEQKTDDFEPGIGELDGFMANKKYSEGASTPVLDGLNESHVAIEKLNKICNNVFPRWNWSSNSSICIRGTRIIIGWDTDVVRLMILAVSDQAIHCQVRSLMDDHNFFISFIYATNHYKQRRSLWRELEMHKCFVRDNPWVMMGDFNASLSLEDSSTGGSKVTISMREFKDCVDNLNMVDVNHMGFRFTWNQRPNAEVGLLKKIDRVMANDAFISRYVDAYVLFQAYRISDHCPAVLKFAQSWEGKPKPFKFSNYIIEHEKFKDVVSEGWKVEIPGHMMFRVTKRLRLLKKQMRKLMWSKGNLHSNVITLRSELDAAQVLLDSDPNSRDLRKKESTILKKYNEAIYEEECFLKQKSKVEWLRVGDGNSRYFHNVVKGRMHRGKIHAIENSEGNIVEGQAAFDVITDHFRNFLGHHDNCSNIVDPQLLFSKKVTDQKAMEMISPVTTDEIKKAMFDINDLKSPGPDGYSAAFFKNAWDIVGEDVVKAVKDFFSQGKLLKEINHTLISLVPKVQSPSKVTDFRPISCCNVMYKCISKVITNRIKLSLDDIVSENQSAFIPNRRISDSIMLTQEIMKNYHLDRGVSRCAFKVDIQKAYDTVNWDFLKATLLGFGFHSRMVNWIMKCVTTASYSININGNVHGYFQGRRGLRQGDPMSPYLFTLVMEVLTLMLRRQVAQEDNFRYHPKCEQLKIINLCFADDLFLFSYANIGSVKVIREALEEFKHCSGLTPSLPKSSAFFSNVTNHLKAAILDILPFDEGNLPVRYLGVPLVSSRLLYQDCKILVERVKHKIDDWKNKSLSFAGRVQLIISVLTSMHIYWASVFILPDAIINDIEKLLRGFLWCQGAMKRGKAKVKWDVLCLPKDEGGLGIKRLKYWNVALMTTHIWSIITLKESLWVKWVYSHHLKNKSFWDVSIKADASWSWRKILRCRDSVRKFMVHKIGDGSSVLAWFDTWCNVSPLIDIVSWRDINATRFSYETRVADLVHNNSWVWPTQWLTKYPILASISVPILSNNRDYIVWKEADGIESRFAVSSVYEAIRPSKPIVPWFIIVWFSHCIPRHAFILWLLMGQKLKTHDKLKSWEVRDDQSLVCSLCSMCSDSHDHLFFECQYARRVWSLVQPHMNAVTTFQWAAVTDLILESHVLNSVDTLVKKLMFAASVHFIW